MNFKTKTFLYSSVASLLTLTCRASNISTSFLPNRTVSLPNFILHMFVANNGSQIDLYEFRVHVHRATSKHLTAILDVALRQDNDAFQSVRLDSTLRQNRNHNETDPRSQIDVSFEGSLTVLDMGQVPDDSNVQTLVEDSFHEKAYWKLIRRFVEDPVLENVDYVDVVVSESSKIEDIAYPGSPNGGAIGALTVFSLVFVFAMGILAYLAYRRFRSLNDMCCSSQSKVSEATDDEGDAGEEFDDENQEKVESIPQRKKKRRKAAERTNVEISGLDSIEEEVDEDGMSNINLGGESGVRIV